MNKQISKIITERGTVQAVPFERYVWHLRGNKEAKMNKIIEACGIYNDKVTVSTVAKYFSPFPEYLKLKSVMEIKTINELIFVMNNAGINMYWDNKYRELMFNVKE